MMGRTMKYLCLALLLTLCCFVSNFSVVGEEPNKPRTLNNLEQQLVGSWIGGGPCVGNAIFQADGDFIFYGYGPGGGYREFGSWRIDSTQVPIRLTFQKDEVSPDEPASEDMVELVVLNEKSLDYKYSGGRIAEHRRGTDRDDFEIRLDVLDSAVQTYLGNIDLGGGSQLPTELQSLIQAKLLPERALKDSLGNLFQYDLAGKHHQGKKPDIWSKDKDGNVIGNWMFDN